MANHNSDTHADAVQHSSKTNSNPTWTGKSDHKMSELGTKFGSVSNKDLTKAEIQTLGEEIAQVEDEAKNGDKRVAAMRLNSFWDDWTSAAVESHIKANSLNKEVNEKYGSRLNQANSYGLLGDTIFDVLSRLNEQRHKPGHNTWSDVDPLEKEFQKALGQALALTIRHYEHLENEHQ
ncbi:hypothetical protein [Halobaculum roseum]|uniref:Uncharacterized protein n=1 Tax=Halobaculum roseum TaxID=2175149 RepID=A0ABD5MGF7_9EURY|nr:hypothetical protein [Halobaculum roseum]QZY02588.1 hypothetical protein K6T36_15070 [Halobaculum roseum]